MFETVILKTVVNEATILKSISSTAFPELKSRYRLFVFTVAYTDYFDTFFYRNIPI